MPYFQPNQKGFTMIEILLVTVIMAIGISGAAGLWYYFVQSYQFTFEQQQAVDMATTTIAQLTKDIREARDGENGSYPLATADDTEIVFFSDINNDGQTERVRYYLDGAQLKQQVFRVIPGGSWYACIGSCTICHNGNTITIPEQAWPAFAQQGDFIGTCEDGPTGEGGLESAVEMVVADFIQNNQPIFTYYNGDWPGDELNNPLAEGSRLLNTRFIRLRLEILVGDSPLSADSVVLENGINLRNLKDNL